MFEKKTRTELIAMTSVSLTPWSVIYDYAEAANAEIDRLNGELTTEKLAHTLTHDSIASALTVLEGVVPGDIPLDQALAKVVAELTAHRSQPAAERVWINSETNPYFPKDGAYLWRWKGGKIEGAGIFLTCHGLLKDREYTLILAEKDFPVPTKPAPLEVKVGKYDVPGQGTAEVLNVIGDKCWYVTTAGKHEVVPVANVRYWLKSNDATFIGEGDNQ